MRKAIWVLTLAVFVMPFAQCDALEDIVGGDLYVSCTVDSHTYRFEKNITAAAAGGTILINAWAEGTDHIVIKGSGTSDSWTLTEVEVTAGGSTQVATSGSLTGYNYNAGIGNVAGTMSANYTATIPGLTGNDKTIDGSFKVTVLGS